jgi:hypothetical protein
VDDVAAGFENKVTINKKCVGDGNNLGDDRDKNVMKLVFQQQKEAGENGKSKYRVVAPGNKIPDDNPVFGNMLSEDHGAGSWASDIMMISLQQGFALKHRKNSIEVDPLFFYD